MLPEQIARNLRNGAVAQSVEQRTENPCVAGSIPAHTTESPQRKLGAFYFILMNFFSTVCAEKIPKAPPRILVGGFAGVVPPPGPEPDCWFSV